MFVQEGTTNADTGWLCTNDSGTDVVGTDALSFTQFTSQPDSNNDFKQSVRVATTAAGTLASDFENGDTIDGVTLATGNRILIKNQGTGSENGIYTVNATGAPTRTGDMPTSGTVAGATVYIEEGDVNGDKGFICTNNAGSDVVGTDALVFARMANSSIPIRVTNFTELSAAVTAGETYINLNAGTYTFTSTITLASNTVLCGAGQDATVFIPTGALGANLISTGANDNIIIKDIQFDGNSEASVNSIALGDGTSNVRIYDCTFTGNAASTDAIDATGAGSGVSNIWIQNCNFDTITGNGISQTAGDAYTTWFVNNCRFTSVTASPIDLNSLTRTFIIQGCTINSCGEVDLQGDSVTFNDNIVIACTSPVTVNDGRINIVGNTFRTFSVDCLEIADVSSIEYVNVTGNTFYTYQANGVDVQCASAVDCRINIEGNTFEGPVGSSAVAINVADQVAEGGSTGGTVLITGNMVETLSTGEGNIVISATGNPFVNVGNNGVHQTESFTGAVSLNGYSDEILVTTTGVTTATLPVISVGSKGHRLYIELEVDGGNLTVTPTSAKNFTSIVFDTAGQHVILEWNGVQWVLLDFVNTPTINDLCYEVNTITEFEDAITMVGNSTNGGSIKILGSIAVSSSVTVPSNCMIFGCGPTVSTIAGSDLLGGILETSTNDNITIKDLRINVAQTATLTIGVSVETGAERVIIDNCHFTNLSASTGIAINDVGAYTIVSNCRFFGIEQGIITTGNAIVSNCHFDTLLLPVNVGSTASDSKFNNCIFDTCGVITIEGVRTEFTNNNVIDSTGNAVDLSNAAADYSIISNNVFQNATTAAITISSTPTNCVISGNTINSPATGISTNGNFTTITSNSIADATTAGIVINTSAESFVISDNTLNNCDTIGIDINSASNGEVSGNTVTDSTNGIDVSSPGALLKIGSNNIEEAVTDPATIDGYTDRVLVTTTTATGATLGDLVAGSAGHTVYIELDNPVGALTITPTNCKNLTSMVLAGVGTYAIFKWCGVEWELIDKSLDLNTIPNDYTHTVNTVAEFTNALGLIGSSTNGGTLILLPGTYTLTSTQTVPENIQIVGSGINETTISGDNVITTLFNANSNDYVFRDITIDINGATTGITSSGITNPQFNNVTFANSDSGGTFISLGSCTDAIITNCSFLNANNIILTGSDRNRVTNNYIESTDISATTVDDSIFDNNILSSSLTITGDRVVVSNNNFISGILSVGANKSIVTNNSVGSITLTSVSDYSVVSGNSTVTITNGGDYVSITGNVINALSGSTIGITSTGIDCTITGNTIETSEIITAIDIGASVGTTEISGNTFSGTTSSNAITINSTGNDFVHVGTGNMEERVTDPATIDGYADRTFVSTTTATACTLSDLSLGSAGHIVYIELDVDAGNLTLTPTSGGNFTSLVLSAAGSYAILEWTGREWDLIERSTGTGSQPNDYTYTVNSVSEFTDAISLVSSSTNGGTIILLPGTYTLTSTVTLGANTQIVGQGKDVTTIAGDNTITTLFTANVNNYIFRDLTIDVNNASTTGVTSTGISDAQFYNVTFTNSDASSGSQYIVVNTCTDTIITNCTFGIATFGAAIGGSGNSIIIVTNCTFDSTSVAVSLTTTDDLIFDSNIVETGAITITGNRAIISNNVCNGSINLSNNPYSIIEGNRVNGSQIRVDSDSIVKGNTINSGANGILCDDDRVSIIGNIFEDLSASANAISLVAGAADCTIIGNIFNDTDITAINLGGSNGATEVSGNSFPGGASTNAFTVSATGNTFLHVGTNNMQENVSDPATIDGYADRVLVTTTTATACTLSDLSLGSAGHRVYIELDVDAGNLTLTPTSFANGTSLLFDDAGDYAIFEWDGDLWHLINNQTGNGVVETITVGNLTNLDSNPTVGNARIIRNGEEITFSATLRCDPTASATLSSFQITLPDAITFSATQATANLECSSIVTGYYDTTTPTSLSNEFAVPVVSTSQLLISFTSSGTANDHFINLIARYTAA